MPACIKVGEAIPQVPGGFIGLPIMVAPEQVEGLGTKRGHFPDAALKLWRRGRALLRKIRLGVMEKELKVRGVWAAVSKQELERATACAAE